MSQRLTWGATSRWRIFGPWHSEGLFSISMIPSLEMSGPCMGIVTSLSAAWMFCCVVNWSNRFPGFSAIRVINKDFPIPARFDKTSRTVDLHWGNRICECIFTSYEITVWWKVWLGKCSYVLESFWCIVLLLHQKSSTCSSYVWGSRLQVADLWFVSDTCSHLELELQISYLATNYGWITRLSVLMKAQCPEGLNAI